MWVCRGFYLTSWIIQQYPSTLMTYWMRWPLTLHWLSSSCSLSPWLKPLASRDSSSSTASSQRCTSSLFTWSTSTPPSKHMTSMQRYSSQSVWRHSSHLCVLHATQNALQHAELILGGGGELSPGLLLCCLRHLLPLLLDLSTKSLENRPNYRFTSPHSHN